MNIKHRILLLGVVWMSLSFRANAAETEFQSFCGILKTGVVASGGETTGITLTTLTNGVYELDFEKNSELKKEAIKCDGEQVVAWGECSPQPGTELNSRQLIKVRSLFASGIRDDADKRIRLLDELVDCSKRLAAEEAQNHELDKTNRKLGERIRTLEQENQKLYAQLRDYETRLYSNREHPGDPVKNAVAKPTE